MTAYLGPFRNPYHGSHPTDIRAAIVDIRSFKERFNDLISEMSRARIEGVDIGEFTAYFDAAWGDTLGASENLAQEALFDMRQAAV